MKKFVKSLLMGALVLSLSVSAMAKDKIFVGTNAEFPPFEYLEKGEVTGFDIELMNEMGKVLDAEVKVQDMAFDGLLPALQMKKVDVVIAGMTATEERKKTVAFTQPYYTASQVIIVKEGDNSIKSFDDLKGKRVGVMLGFTGDTVVSEIEGVKVERFNAAYAGIMALKADKVDAVVLDSEPAKNYVKQNAGLKIAEADAAQEEYAIALRKNDKELLEKIEKALAETLKQDITVEELIALVLEVGKYGVAGMELLDRANTKNYGDPEITKVNIGVGKNPGILISGHDLKDLEMLLEQTQGTGVDVYTHSEMLPAHYYPKFKKYSNFIGNYGNAWWKQQEEFESFNGPIIMTTNCIVPPKESYKNRIFTTGLVSFEGCKHIDGEVKDFSEVIEMAKRTLPPKEIETGEIIGGFAHNQVFQLADKIVEAIKNGDIKRFVVMGGCDGRSKKREYYTEFAKNLPKDTVILTAGCAKYRYNKLDLGMINGIPRVLDAGQCNDSYSLALIALKLKEVFNLDDINKLPIIYNISWYEQKAVIVLLSLLYLGVKNIHLGPTLPGFLSPNVAKVLIENFNIGGIGEVEEDLERFFK